MPSRRKTGSPHREERCEALELYRAHHGASRNSFIVHHMPHRGQDTVQAYAAHAGWVSSGRRTSGIHMRVIEFACDCLAVGIGARPVQRATLSAARRRATGTSLRASESEGSLRPLSRVCHRQRSDLLRHDSLRDIVMSARTELGGVCLNSS